jgi:Zn-dependent protease with chaperone function
VAGLPYLLAVAAIVTTWRCRLNGLSRFGERQADHFALEVSHRPGVFIELFERLAVHNLSPLDAPAWEADFYAPIHCRTHPHGGVPHRLVRCFYAVKPSAMFSMELA